MSERDELGVDVYRALLDNADIGVWLWSVDGVLLTCNLKAAEYMGAGAGKAAGPDPEAFIGKGLEEIPGAEAAPLYLERIERVAAGEGPLRFEDDCLQFADGTHCFASTYRRIDDSKGDPVGVEISAYDVTGQRRIERALRESEANLQALIDSTDDQIVLYDREGRTLIYNEIIKWVAKVVFGGEPYRGQKMVEHIPEPFKSGFEAHRRIVLSGNKSREVVSYTLETGETLTYDFVFNPAYLGDEIIGFSQVGRNITELKRTEEQLRQALQEKELLMKELNHRIKNNLAMISSLIGLKESEYDHEVDLTDIEHQIDAIRIVHEMLYKGDDITHIDMQTYVQELLLTIFSSFSMQHVRIENEIEQASVRTKFAIPLGLIINEIAINAIKHGFDHGEEAWFSIRLWKDPAENRRVLEMSNSGSSFPEEIPLENPETLGLRLVSVLVDQIGGTIELERFPATTFRISFPAV